jgi:hypothetical protein
LLAAGWVLCATVAGCASPMGQPWADYRTSRQIDKIVADDSFPSAAEVGLAVPDDAKDQGS